MRRWWWGVVVALVAAVGLVALLISTDDPEEPAAPAERNSVTAPTDPPLVWPFATMAQAAQWQSDYQTGGHSPWHIDAEATALAFTTGYLGFTEIDQVVRSTIDTTSAEVTVGYRAESAQPHDTSAAAVLRLVRLGGGADAPWEVVGGAGDTLTVTEPAPGAEVSSPLRVGGRITGVDESIRVLVRDPAVAEPIGDACCTPAGGEQIPWSATVEFTGARSPTVTVVAATGGHVTDVERFAVVGVAPTGS
jgi:hypothetical protein